MHWPQNTWPWMIILRQFLFFFRQYVWISELGYSWTLLNVVEHQTETNGIARFPCDGTGFLLSKSVTFSWMILSINAYIVLYIVANMLWQLQMRRPVFCRPSRRWSLHLRSSLSRTLGCSMNFCVLTFWPKDRPTTFAVRERCSEETTLCLMCWRQKTSRQKSSASSFWQPCSELANNTSSTSSHRMEVRNTMMS